MTWSVAALALLGLAALGVAIWVYVVNNVEQPKFEVVQADGSIELRDYAPIVVAEVTRSGSRREAVNAGFRPLANYIFAKSRSGGTIPMTAPVTQSLQERVEMTAPVTQRRTGSATTSVIGVESSWSVQFIMPAEYDLADLPEPADDDVKLRQVPARRMAAIRFSGVATDGLLARKETELKAWLNDRRIRFEDDPLYAYYNDPFTPGFLRRNEILLPVESGP